MNYLTRVAEVRRIIAQADEDGDASNVPTWHLIELIRPWFAEGNVVEVES